MDDILGRCFDPPVIVTSGRPLKELPSVEERMPEIRVAVFHSGRPVLTSIVPMLSSIGCPYTCGFCVDWNSHSAALPAEQLHADLDYSSKSGRGARKGREKLEKILSHLEELSRHVPGIHANFLFGCDSDEGEEPVALTNEFIRRLPQVWPTINIPVT